MLPTHIHPDSFLTAGYLLTRDLVPKHVLHTGFLKQFFLQTLRSLGVKVNPGVSVNPVWVF